MKELTRTARAFDYAGIEIGRDVVVLDHENGTVSIGVALYNDDELVMTEGYIEPAGLSINNVAPWYVAY